VQEHHPTVGSSLLFLARSASCTALHANGDLYPPSSTARDVGVTRCGGLCHAVSESSTTHLYYTDIYSF